MDNLTVSQWVHGCPSWVSWGVSSRICRARLVCTSPLRPSGGILAACVTSIHQGAASRAGSLVRSTLAAVIYDAFNGRQVCTKLLSRAACWSGPLGPLRGAASGSGGHFNSCYHVETNTTVWIG